MLTASREIQRRSYEGQGEDAHGNETESWSDPAPFKVFGYGPRSDGQAEPRMPGRDAVVIGLSVYAPASPKPHPHDRFVIAGEEYEVEGEIGDWTNGPFSYAPGISFALRRVEG